LIEIEFAENDGQIKAVATHKGHIPVLTPKPAA
jgi:hypothetical protein